MISTPRPIKALLLAFSIIFVTNANADLYMELKIETRMVAADGSIHSPTEQSQWIWAGENNVRSETNDVITVMNLGSGVVNVITPAIQSYMEMSAEAIGGALGGAEMTVSVTDTGETQKMNQYTVRGYEQVLMSPMGNSRTIIWATEDIDVKTPSLLSRVAVAAMGLLQSADSEKIEAMETEIAKIKGVPLVSFSAMLVGEETLQTKTSLVAITEEEAPAGAYVVPEGYSRMEMPGMEDIADNASGSMNASAGASTPKSSVQIDVPEHNVSMTTISDAAMGYVVDVPEGFKTLQKSDYAHTFTKVLPGGAHEYNINISPLGARDMEDALNTATMVGGKKVEEKIDLGDGYWIKKSPRGPLQQIWVFRNGTTKPVSAKCTGPAGDVAVLIHMCASLQASN